MINDVLRRLFGRSVRYRPSRGDLCSVVSGGGMYGIVKVLVIERGVVHVRVYREKFSKRPESIDATVLTLGSVDGGGDFGMGHLPLSDASFATWVPVPIQNEPVADAELAGYRMWQDHSGGVW